MSAVENWHEEMLAFNAWARDAWKGCGPPIEEKIRNLNAPPFQTGG
jgi:hypothetical protein